MANIATITNNIISALSGTTSQVLLGDATLTDFKLDSLTDVNVPTPGDGDVLRWNAATSLWEASDAAGLTGSGTTNYLPKFTGASTLGNSIITESASIVSIINGTLALSNAYNLTGRNAANTINIALIGRNSSDRVVIDADGYGTNIGGGGSVLINPTGGNVGIGTTSPTSYTNWTTLSINNATNGGVIDLLTNNVRIGSIYTGVSGANLNINAIANVPLVFFTNDTERARITAVGNVGIGTSAPSFKLDVQGNAGGITINTNGAILSGTEFITGSGVLASSSSATDVAIKAGSTTLMTLKSFGYIGIGTTTPNAPLQIENGYDTAEYNGFRFANSPKFVIASDNTDVFQRILGGSYGSASTVNLDLAVTIAKNKGVAGTGFRLTSGVGGGGVGTPNGYLSFSTLTGELNETYTPSELMRLTYDGNLGIGTTAPSEKLDVFGKIQARPLANGSIGNFWYMIGSVTDVSNFGVANGIQVDSAALNSYAMTFGTQNSYITGITEKMRITSAGLVGIGTTAPTGYATISSDQAFGLEVYRNNSQDSRLSLTNTTVGQGGGKGLDLLQIGLNSNIVNNANGYIAFFNNGSERVRITSTGIVSVGGTDGLTTSTYAGKLSVYTAGGANLSIGGGSNTTNTVMSRFITVNTNNANSGNESSSQFYGITSIESALTTATSNSSLDSGGYIMLKTKGDGGTLDERMRITSTGNVGIGTTSIDSANKLQVEGGYINVRGVGGGGGGFYTSWPNTANADARTWGWGSSINLFGDFGINQSNAKDGNPITAGTTRFYISNLGNVGIGTTSPLTQLHVNDGVNVSNLTMLTLSQFGNDGNRDIVNFKMSFNNGNVPGIMMSAVKNAAAGTDLTLSTGGDSNGVLSEKMRILSGGNVGIGTSAPVAKLHISGPLGSGAFTYLFAEKVFGYGSAEHIINYINAGGEFIHNDWTIGSGTIRISQDGYNPLGSPSSIRFLTAPSGGSITERMRISQTGNVGIGTASPVVALDVRGEVAIAYNATYGLRFYNDARNNWSSIGNTITGSSDSNLVFKSATGVMTFNGLGRLIIGSAADTSELLQVNGTMKVTGASTFGGAMTVNNIIDFKLSGSTYYQLFLQSPSANFKIYNSNYGRTDLEFTQTTGAATFSSSVTATENYQSNSFTNTVSVGTTLAGNKTYNYIGYSGYWGIKTTSTNFNFSLDVYNSGTPINALTINQIGGAATFSSTIQSTGSNGFAIGSLTNNARIQYGSDAATSFTLLTAANGYAGLYASSGVFSSSLTVGTDVTLNNGTLYVSSGSGVAYSSRLSTAYSFPYIDTYLDSYAGTSWEGRLNFRTNSGGGAMTTQLSIANSGAATFSSSVTATGLFSTGASNLATSSGNVGIGTSNPTEGKLVVSNSGPSIIYLKETSVGVNSFWNSSDGSEVQFGSLSNHPLKFFTNNTTKLTITNTGEATFLGSVTSNVGYVAGTGSLSSNVSILFKTDTGDFSLINQRASHSFGIYDNLNSSYRLNFDSFGAAIFSSNVSSPSLYLSNPLGLNINNYNFYSSTVSGSMGIIGHNLRASSTVANQVDVINGSWYSSMIKMYYNQGITFHTSTTIYNANDIYPITSTERMRIANDGNVGIGVSIPAYKLDVNGTFNTSGAGQIGTTSTTGYSLVVANSGASDFTGIRLTTGGANNGYLIAAYNSASLYGSIQAGDNNAYQNLVLNNSGGSVGVGTSIITDKLTVSGDYSMINSSFKSSARAAGYLNWRSGGNSTERSIAVASIAGWDEYAGSSYNGSLRFYTQQSNVLYERIRVKPNGQLRFVPLASDPSGAEAGDVYYNSTTNVLKYRNASTWNDMAPSSSTYTPTLTLGTNASSGSVSVLNYFKNGSMVHVIGKVTVTSSTNAPTIVYLSLPIASAFTSNDDAVGFGDRSTIVASDIANDRFELYLEGSTTATEYGFMVTYVIK